ncbi:MAG TPA: c-type cytochrome biogenesis protein CcmI [Thauera sp.]|uniref:c-type cytochrome biogenesis protein CcmI n=1 Tax=Thauera sp. WB-2 TaxID=2897772 RepID=UPI0022DE6822|nr:c-type cytochrome biogenesis protein CcmI [Thauera sp. WB-2]WBL64175.1 c-type cytochrome biogenesis protein CcmI [Thauera sp. WB-2]HRJ22573.1 c-type cytochrome biogenesis protein CcmI [Thauera sp.]HRK09984.1 c-type cytochrome biogenesis protein CcmI [Thauera sp.]
MTAFILLAGLLLAGALLLIVPPLLGAGARQRREQARQSTMALTVLREQLAELDADLASGQIDAESHARSREELERRALEEGEAAAEAAELADARPSRGWAVAMAVSIPAVAIASYLAIGEPEALDPANLTTQQGFTREQVNDMVGQLVARLEQEPDNVEGWTMLARTYMVLEDYPKAVAAFARLGALVPDDPDVLADWADATAVVSGTVQGEAEALAQRALAVAPQHVKALAIAGTGAYQRKDFATAAGHWERILAQIPATNDMAKGLRDSINDARAKAGLEPLAALEGAAPAAAAPVLTISGRLSLSAELADKVQPADVVFVFVRAEAGGPPFAALRFTAAELPLDFDFDGATLMMGDMPIPERVVVAARVAKGGDATARSGDLEGASPVVSPDSEGLSVVIDRVRE